MRHAFAKRLCGLVLLALAVVRPALAQGTFQNWDFEAAFPNIQPDSPRGQYPVTTTLPGWTVYYGVGQHTSSPQSQMGYQFISLGQTFVSLLSTGGPSTTFTRIDGRYSVLLQGGVTASDASIRQTGLVPAQTQSLLFKSAYDVNGGPLMLSLNGQNIPFYAMGAGTNYTLFGGDVSAFAGQTATLGFSAPQGYSANNNWNLDDISFSPNPIPEPGVLAFFCAGALVVAVCRRKAGRTRVGAQYPTREEALAAPTVSRPRPNFGKALREKVTATV